MASDVRALILTGFGLNCEAESARAFELAGAVAEQVHLNDLLDGRRRLEAFHILFVIGGFSFGDHIASGRVLANRLKRRLAEPLQRFIADGKLILGVCNGFQVLVKLGVLPGLEGDYRRQTTTLTWNDTGLFRDAWVHLAVEPRSPCVFTRGIRRLYLPVRHGEGKFLALDGVLGRLESEGLVACRYADPATGQPTQAYPHNPNGSAASVAGICDPTGRLFGMMPHPEAYLFPWNHPHYAREAIAGDPPAEGGGVAIFRNAVAFARENLL
ncbi:MAG: phosphoribosylformylglycinamidine synthase subunit PurQ [Candidatus Brocadiia bacterium]